MVAGEGHALRRGEDIGTSALLSSARDGLGWGRYLTTPTRKKGLAVCIGRMVQVGTLVGGPAPGTTAYSVWPG
jgi:hypothetical protein